MSQVLYRKYRPKTFEEVEGQEHVVRTLQGALMSGRLGHAYLFCGPRGTGKTTMARLLAKRLNCKITEGETKFYKDGSNYKWKEPCNACYSCSEINEGRSLDLIEVDAASNRGIDEIRNLKDSARVAATGGKHKVFIVDECLTGDSLILMGNGTVKKISEINNGDQVVSVDLNNGDLIPKSVSNFFSRSSRESLEITSTQSVIKCTPGHRLWVLRDGDFTLTAANNLEPDDYLVSPLILPHQTHSFFTAEQLTLLAIIQCDGHISKDSSTIQVEINKDAPYFEKKIKEGLKSWGVNSRPVITTTKRGTTLIRVYSADLKNKLVSLGCPAGKKSQKIDIPAAVFQAPLSSIKAYIDACFCCEGDASWTESTRLFKLSFTSTSYPFALKLQLLLKKFGIVSSLMSILRQNKKHSTAFRLNLTGYDLRLFQKLIGLSMQRKADVLLGQLSHKLKTDTMPFLAPVKRLIKELNISRSFLGTHGVFPTEGQNLSRTSFESFVDISGTVGELSKFLNFRYEKILRIKKIKKEVKVYDFTVEDTHTFIVNGFCSSNCHMLTKEANNALLKLLEEPPSHVVFVLATTEPHKVPDTVLSRVQRFDFKKISTEKIQKKLLEIAEKEKIKIDNDSLTLVASSASGSLRDAESALNKLIAYAGDTITDEQVAEALGIVPHHVHQKLLELIRQKNGREAIAQTARLYEAGVDMENFVKQFVRYLRTKLIGLLNQPFAVSSTQSEPEFLIKVINIFVKAGSELKFSPVPQLPVELAILEAIK